jgi:hypothetical protein
MLWVTTIRALRKVQLASYKEEHGRTKSFDELDYDKFLELQKAESSERSFPDDSSQTTKHPLQRCSIYRKKNLLQISRSDVQTGSSEEKCGQKRSVSKKIGEFLSEDRGE